MKINSEKLYDFINNLGTNEKVRFKVFYDDNYVTEIYWDGENFRWEPGTFTTGALFNPLYDFVEVEEEKKDNFTGWKMYQDGKEVCSMDCSVEEKKIPEKLEDKAKFQYSQIPYWFKDKELIKTINENFEKHQKAIYEIINYLKSKGDE